MLLSSSRLIVMTNFLEKTCRRLIGFYFNFESFVIFVDCWDDIASSMLVLFYGSLILFSDVFEVLFLSVEICLEGKLDLLSQVLANEF